MILFEKQNTIGILTFNQPDKLNALDEEMAKRFSQVLEEIKKDSSLRVLILTGAGRAFSSGGNLDMITAKFSKTAEVNKNELIQFYKSFLALRDLSIPVIAAINGPAVGAGFCVALACDLRYAASNARMGANFAKIGLAPGMGGTYLITRLVGPTRASEILMLADTFDAKKALEMGLLNDIYEPSELLPKVMEIASKLAKNGPLPLRQIKKGISKALHSSLEEMFLYDSTAQAECFQSLDIREGIEAIREKREPHFNGK